MAEYEGCRILLVDKKISTARDIVGVLEGAIRGGYPLMIMAEDIEQEALATLVVNKLRGRCACQLSLHHALANGTGNLRHEGTLVPSATVGAGMHGRAMQMPCAGLVRKILCAGAHLSLGAGAGLAVEPELGSTCS